LGKEPQNPLNKRKGKVKLNFALKQTMKAQMGSRDTIPFFNLVGWVVNATPRPIYPGERDPVPIVQEAGWAPRSVWTGV
jgi:hypothetical protein